MSQATIKAIFESPKAHWVGDGFHVSNFIPSLIQWSDISPFLMLDYGQPKEFKPTLERLGVGPHPHRGFETVTIAYQGEVEHHDSRGNHGIIQPGEVQWMTAGEGILHQEYHSKYFAQTGGILQMVQLWVNLPSIHKMTPAKYQGISKDMISITELEDQAGSIAVIAGNIAGTKGPAQTFSTVNLYNLNLNQDKTFAISVPFNHNCALLIISGSIQIKDQIVNQNQLILLNKNQSESEQLLSIKAIEASTILVLSGIPIDEPIASYGPFVMNTQQEIVQAIEDFNSGKFGEL